WRLDGFKIPRGDLADRLDEALRPFELRSVLFFSDVVPRIALFVSNLSHCLYDILGRWRSGEWRVDVPLVVSNHGGLPDAARRDAGARRRPARGEDQRGNEPLRDRRPRRRADRRAGRHPRLARDAGGRDDPAWPRPREGRPRPRGVDAPAAESDRR